MDAGGEIGGPMSVATTYWWAVTRVSVALPLAAIAAVWLVGDQSYMGTAEGGLDYLVDPLPVTERAIAIAGAVSVAALLVVTASLWRHRGLWGPLVCLVGAGALVGGSYRTVTAGVVGANIGGGLVLFVTPPVLLAVLVTAIVWIIRQCPRESGS